MSEDDKLVKLIEGPGCDSGDPVFWRLPVQEKHRDAMKGHVADLGNTGSREGGKLGRLASETLDGAGATLL